MYKDEDRQREAVKLATRRYRNRLKGITEVSQRITPVILTQKTEEVDVIPDQPMTQSHNPMMVGYVPPQD